MSDPVAVPIAEQFEPPKPTVERKKNSEDLIVDEGFDHNTYFNTYGVPYVADHLGIRDLYSTDPSGDIKATVQNITDFLLDEADGEPLIFVMKDIASRMEEEMNLKDNDAGLYKLKMLNKLVGMKQKVKELDKMKRQAIDDINSMI